MKSQRVGAIVKDMRSNQTQEQLAMDLNVARETLSKYENGRSKLPADISKTLTNKYNNPRFAMTVRQEYTGIGPVWLDGPNVDLHRSSVKEKALEEMREAIEVLEKFSLSKPLKRLQLFERQSLEEVLDELVEVQTAIDHMVAVVCEEAEISLTKVWERHYKHLAAEGYIGGLR